MAVRIGPFDPLKLVFNLINQLLQRGVLNYDQAREILKDSLDPEMTGDEKEKLLDTLMKKP